MVKKLSKAIESTAAPKPKPRRKFVPVEKGAIADEAEQILQNATKHLVFEHGMFLVATGLRAVRIKGLKVWIIAVTLRYTTGHEGYIGDLLYDGDEFTFLTPADVRKERTREIAADPERKRKWHESQAATLPAGKG